MGARFRRLAPLPFFEILVIFIVPNDVDPYLGFYNRCCPLQCLNEGKYTPGLPKPQPTLLEVAAQELHHVSMLFLFPARLMPKVHQHPRRYCVYHRLLSIKSSFFPPR
jgi:hypothetical protein